MPSLAQNQIIDPILSNIALGYIHPEHVGSALFPVVPVRQSGGKIVEFGKEAFRLYSTSRAPGANAKRMRFGHNGAPYAVENHALDAVVPREWMRDAQQVPHINLATRAVNMVLRSGSLMLEYQQATIATTAANYDANHKVTLAGTSQWSDYVNSDPIGDVNTARQEIRATIGIYPNVIEISSPVFDILCEHPAILAKIKYSERAVVTEEILANVLKIKKVVVGKAIAFDDADASIEVWGKDVVLAYVPEAAATQEEPSYGYTYQIEGHPMVEVPFWDQSARSWIYGMTNERVPVQTSMTAGFLIKSAIA